MKTMKFMYFWFNYSDMSNHLERIQISVKNISHLVCMASELLEFDKLHPLLISDGTRTDDDGYLKGLETAAESTVCN